MVETRPKVTFFKPTKNKHALGSFNCITKEIKIMLPRFIKYEYKNDDDMIDAICYTIEHEYVHYSIDRYGNVPWEKRCLYEEIILGALIGRYETKEITDLSYIKPDFYWDVYRNV